MCPPGRDIYNVVVIVGACIARPVGGIFRMRIGLQRIRSLLPPDVTRSPVGCGIPDASCAAPPKATMSLRRPQACGNLLFDFPKNLQEIATSALWGLLAMTFIIVGHAIPTP